MNGGVPEPGQVAMVRQRPFVVTDVRRSELPLPATVLDKQKPQHLVTLSSVEDEGLAHRERNSAGRPGKLHAKCAVLDETALVGSGNLTDDAFNRNMEFGLMVRDGTTADALHSHFMALVERGVLVRTDVEQ